MRAAMVEAEVGDDVYGEDPTVNRLEELAAKMLGTEAALFSSSGTQSNLLALMTHCGRGDEYIVGQKAHTYIHEGGGAAVFGSIQPQPLDLEPDGTLNLDKVAEVIKPDDFHYARTRLLCLENTHDGRALPMDYLKKAHEFARDRKLKLHLDGARIFNAAIRLQVPVTDISRYFDSVSICLSKGLGAPVGSLLCANGEFIKKARRWRKVLGGGMRQAGIIAAAGIYALEKHIDRLQEDHEKAALLDAGLREIKGLEIESSAMQTNMVFFKPGNTHSSRLPEYLKEKGIVINGGRRIRLVTHLDIHKNDIPTVIKAFKNYF